LNRQALKRYLWMFPVIIHTILSSDWHNQIPEAGYRNSKIQSNRH
jgi:hypothetical protein